MQNRPYSEVLLWLMLLLLASLLASACLGAIDISIDEIAGAFSKLFHQGNDYTLHERIFLEIRLPRVLFCLLAGAALAVGGVLLQALFRNPIIEPGLIGTSSGAAFGAALYFVAGATFHFNAGVWMLPLAACAGAMLATFMVLALSGGGEDSRTGIVTLLLMGIAINALFLSGTGFLSYIARDPQARSITFWNLGTLSGASWESVLIVAVVVTLCCWRALACAAKLNLLMLGEEEAQLSGVNVRRLKMEVMIVNVIMIAVVTAFTGVISFVGLVVPHFLRIWKGADNRYLVAAGALAGAVLLTTADIAARLLLRPAELPIGIVTSFAGVPVLIFLLKKKKYYF